MLRFRLLVVTLVLFLAACSSGSGSDDVKDSDVATDNVALDAAQDTTLKELAEEETTLVDTVIPDGQEDLAVDLTPVDPNRPADQCNVLESPWGSDALFVDKSAQYQLDEDGMDIIGNRLTAADLDGDGYPDLIIHMTGSNDRDDPAAGTFKRRILMNRADGNGGRTFEDFTVASKYGTIPGTEELGRAAHLAIFADVDNDGDLDAFSGTYSDKNNETKIPDRSIILLNDGNGVFTPVENSGVSPEEEWTTTSAAFLDYNNDGNVDLWVGNFYVVYGYLPGLQDRLYKGNGDGTFTDVTYESGLGTTDGNYSAATNHRPTYGVTSCDVDGDGDMDLLQSSYGRQFNMLWLNDGKGLFIEASQATGYNADDNMDYSDNQFYGCYCQSNPDVVCDPEPGPVYIQCSGNYWGSDDDKPYRNGGNTFSTLCADLDGDLDMDVFNAEIVHWHIGQSSDPSQILVNTPAQNPYRFVFERPGREATGMVRPREGSWNEGDIYITAFDGDNDGVMDIFLPSSDYPGTHGWYFRGLGDGKFVDIDLANTSGLSLDRIGGVAHADFDRDGDEDVVVAFSTMRCDADCEFTKPVVRLFENQTDQRANWTRIRLKGNGAGASNGAAIGAKVIVTTAIGSQMREVNGGYGHFGMQNTTDAHFGLGDACVMDKVEVHWPNAEHTVSVYHNVPANYPLVIQEKAEFPEYETIQ